MNLGSLFLIFLWIVFQALVWILTSGPGRNLTCCKTVKKKLTTGLFWGSVLEFMMQAYLEICFAVVL